MPAHSILRFLLAPPFRQKPSEAFSSLLEQYMKLIMDARKEARITGVEKVISFEPDLVFLITEAGKMKITGKDMHTAKAVDCCSNISVII